MGAAGVTGAEWEALAGAGWEFLVGHVTGATGITGLRDRTMRTWERAARCQSRMARIAGARNLEAARIGSRLGSFRWAAVPPVQGP
jgi:hypothetical protein